MNTIRLFSFVLLLGLSSGCGDWTKYTSVKPEIKNLAGIYQPTPETAAMFANQGYNETNIRIVLYADEKFEMQNMPGCWLGSWDFKNQCSHSGYDSADGKWSLDDNGMNGRHVWGINFDFQNQAGIKSIKNLSGKVGGPLLRNETPPYILKFSIGDPDGSPLCEFSKIADVKN